MKTKRIGLVLQGGGALGAYECGVVKGLYKHYPDFHLDVVFRRFNWGGQCGGAGGC
jgi:predicted acylesterase/phospholipase RssA